MLEPFVVVVPVCLAVPEEPVDEPLLVFEPEVVISLVTEAEGLCVCAAEPEPVQYQSVC